MARRARIDDVPLGPAVYNFARRFRENHIKLSTIIARCTSIDRNHDGVIHINDLEDILMDYLGADRVPRREVIQLGRLLQSQRKGAQEGAIEFDRLQDTVGKVIRDMEKEKEKEKEQKKQLDGVQSSESKRDFDSPSRRRRNKSDRAERVEGEEYWYDPVTDTRNRPSAYAMGSIGHFLDEIACPAESRNFQHFMYCMEKYEKLTGLDCQPTRDGFIIPMGPDMKAKVTFVMGGTY